MVVYVDSDLTEEENSSLDATCKEYEEYPENFISLDEVKKIYGITDEALAKLPPLKIVYN